MHFNDVVDMSGQRVDEFVVYGENGAYHCYTRKQPTTHLDANKDNIGEYVVEMQPVDMKPMKKKENAFHCGYFLPNTDGFYVLGGDSGYLYLCSQSQVIMSYAAHSKYLAAISSHPCGFVTAGGDGLWKLWEMTNLSRGVLQQSQQSFGESYSFVKQTPRTTFRKLKASLRVKLEDKFQMPKYKIGGGAHACAYNRSKEQLIIGTNECDIVVIEKFSDKVK
ncbi:hypothetical protein RFI_05955 [Reticulomyxa filosa]|uniref:Uncharacterized protein n=1 Tax=Reticulomyxa filosa TaxID=46433 RepID=X6NZ52_RETFI|nr:hypothetical protein RFI_05955 [Reticulomyxa filosa]|eukprot:ETO31163.1 hypothetical protein RFI_05955 [Reticulomyxa filosa]